MRDYMYQYLEIDVRFLADVMENFRKNIISLYQLDPINYITLPQLTFSAAFRNTKLANGSRACRAGEVGSLSNG